VKKKKNKKEIKKGRMSGETEGERGKVRYEAQKRRGGKGRVEGEETIRG
jgi:hypothetical protein